MKIKIDLYFSGRKWSKNDIFKDIGVFSEISSKALEMLEASNICKILNFDIMFTTDRRIKKYNLDFRNKAQATNVLSFPAEKLLQSDLKKFKRENLYLGEIIFSFETIKKESEKRNKTFREHLLHLFTHAFLHLLGYEHNNLQDRETMEKLEILILKNFGIRNPYESIL